MIRSLPSHLLLVIPLVLGCQKQSPTRVDDLKGMPVVQAADGTYYVAQCLKENGFSNMSQCKFNSDRVLSSRGFHNNWWSNWWQYYSYAYSCDPRYYDQSSFCGGLFGINNCYGYFGYNQPVYSDYYVPDCSTGCLYGTSHPERCENRCWRNTWWGNSSCSFGGC